VATGIRQPVPKGAVSNFQAERLAAAYEISAGHQLDHGLQQLDRNQLQQSGQQIGGHLVKRCKINPRMGGRVLVLIDRF